MREKSGGQKLKLLKALPLRLTFCA